MKKQILAVLLSSSFALTAQATLTEKPQVKYVGDTEYASFCKAVLEDNVLLFKRSLKRFVGPLGGNKQGVLQRVLENNNVQCAGQGLIEFSENRKATQVAKFISNSAA